MTAKSPAAAGAVQPARFARALRCTLLSTALAAIFGLSVIVEVSNVPAVPPQAAGTTAVVRAASDTGVSAPGQPAAPPAEGLTPIQ